MEINAQTNTFVGGMNCDVDLNYIQSNQYRYGENIRITTNDGGTTAVIQGIEKNKQYNLNLYDYQNIIGTATAKWFNVELNKEEDCAIIITSEERKDGYGFNNTLYVVTGFDTDDLIQHRIVTAHMNLKGNLSIITNYESQYVSNVYFTDGNGIIKVVNIQKEYKGDYSDTAFDILPDSILQQFEFDGFSTGTLPAGQVQYAYKLFNKHGVETALSPLSKKIPLTKGFKETDSQKVKGQRITENTGLGCKITAQFLNNPSFEYIRIYRMHYSQNNQIPEVCIVDELAITNNYLSYVDTGGNALSVLSSDEVNNLIPFQFKAKTLEKLDNRLFAANIQNDDWDVEYDARAYRCDSNGFVALNSNKSSDSIQGLLNSKGQIIVHENAVVVPEDHDCINPSNVDVTSDIEPIYQYGYVNGKLIKGGTGPNVSYRFVYTELVQSSETAADGNYPIKDLYMHANKASGAVNTYYEDGTLAYSKNYGSIIPNYADAKICANFTGYRRDEIYRFGIVFYNQKMVPSPVHWIGDIRMPYSTDAGSVSFPFHKGVNSKFYNKTVELASYALGIEFTVNNVPNDVVGYEIVRCDRTENDSTIVTQGALSKLVKFTDWSKGIYTVGKDIDIRPQAWLNVISDNLSTKYHHDDGYDYDTHYFDEEYYEFVSPEISFSKDLMLPQIENGKLSGLYWLDSHYSQRVSQDVPFGFNIQKRMYVLYEEEKSIIVNIDDFYPKANEIGYIERHETDQSKDQEYVIYTGEGYTHEKQGFAAVFKYYTPTTGKSKASSTQDATIKSAIITKLLPVIPMTISDAKTHLQLIGNKKYVNLSILGYRQYSNHGISAILQFEKGNKIIDDLKPVSSGLGRTPTMYVTTKVYNIKKDNIGYGGNSYSVRSNSVYVSCGAYTTNNPKVVCYGGDTYLNIFEHQNTTAIQYDEDVSKERELRICTVAYIPLESSINLNLRHDESYSRTVEGDLAQNLIQNDIQVFPNTYSQDEPLYQYNPAYSAQTNIANFVSKPLYAEDDMLTSNRIVCSELKINNEIIDAWSKFKFANYLDVDSQYGPITNLKVFRNKLYYFQNNAVGIAAVNERSIITDNNPGALVLGTGGILTRYDYLVEQNGNSIVNDKSIIDTKYGLYWYDYDKNVICSLGQSFQELSKIKNVQSYLNSIYKENRLNSMSLYDSKYNEVQFRITDKNLVFNENLQTFTSFYTHVPDFALMFSDKLITIKHNKFFLHNQDSTGLNFNEESLAKVTFIVNDNSMYTKVYDNQWFSGDFIEDKKLIKKIQLTTKNQIAEAVNGSKIDYREDTYRFAIPREVQKEGIAANKSYAGRMRGKYLICDYTFDCSGDKEFRLPYVKTTYRYSML